MILWHGFDREVKCDEVVLRQKDGLCVGRGRLAASSSSSSSSALAHHLHAAKTDVTLPQPTINTEIENVT